MSIKPVENKRQIWEGATSRPSGRGRAGAVTMYRPFRKTDREYQAIVAIENANMPESPFCVDEFRFYDESWDARYMHQRIVAEQNGRVVGFATFGEPWWSHSEGKYYFSIAVHPALHGEGLQASLYDAVLAALAHRQPTRLVSEIREDQRYVIDLLDAEGFEAVMRFPVSVLDVQQFAAQAFDSVCDQVHQSGIRVDSLRVVAAEDGGWQRKLWDLDWELVQDVPSPEPHTRMSFEHWQRHVLESPNFTADGHMIARDGQRFIGMSVLLVTEATPEKLYTGLTGVIRPYRRRGVATAMKVQGIRFAQACGVTVIQTVNEENNPMLDLNKRLGFKETPAFVSYEKQLDVVRQDKEAIRISA